MAVEIKDIVPPLLGVDRRLAFQHQKPFSCADAMNIWPRDAIAGRMRTGSRPGLVKIFPNSVTGPCHLIANVRVVENTGLVTYLDDFNGNLSGAWEQATWLPDSVSTGPGYVGVGTRKLDPSSPLGPNAGLVLKELDIESGSQYDVSIQILHDIPLSNVSQDAPMSGKYSIYARMDNSNPNVTVAGVELQWNVQLPYSDKRTNLRLYDNGDLVGSTIPIDNHESLNPKTLGLRIDDTANTATILVDGVVKRVSSIGAAVGRRVGFGITGDGDLTGGYHFRRIDWLRLDYEGEAPTGNRNVVVALGGTNAASSEVDIRYEDTPNVLVAPSVVGEGAQPAITNTNARQLHAVELLGRLYIVGEDSNETGTQNDTDNTTKEEGAPIWQFNPTAAGSLVTLNTSTDSAFPYVDGLVPGDCSVIAAWRQRLCVIARADPQNIYMSQSGVPGNWEYRTIPPGSPYRLNLTGTDTSKLGSPINCLIGHSDDYLLMGSFNSLSVFRGDPTLGGQIDSLSSNIGIVAPQAWARGPNGETAFLTTDGLYAIPAGVLAYPESVSRERLPNELRDIDVNNYRILMAYDIRNRGVFIGLTPNLGGGGKYLWFDWENRGFWPMEFDKDHEPTSLVYRNADSPLDQRLLFGCRDGNIRAFDDSAFNDDGVPVNTNLLMGPIALGGGGYNDGMLLEVVGQTGVGSVDVTCDLKIGNSVEAARNATARTAYTFKAGKNLTHRPRLRGNSVFLRLSTTGQLPWAFENLTIAREKLGKQRL